MRTPRSPRFLALLLLGFSLSPIVAQTDVPEAKITELRTALNSHKEASSAARKRLAVKRVVRDAGKLLEAHPDAPNRFEILGLVFAAQQKLFTLDDSSRNRDALLETSRELVKAPNRYATLRLDADLLLSQTEMARAGTTPEARVAALRPMVKRYRDTPAEAKMLRIAMIMALELGDRRLVNNLRQEMATRFAGDLEMIIFQREKLGGQVFGAPFCGTFKRSDGTTAHYPADGLGQTTALYFWSRDDGLADLDQLAKDWIANKDNVAGRLNIVSINIDELPDAGEKILRDKGLDWPALHLPGGEKNIIYQAFARRTPAILTLSPTGYAALVMSGSTRKRVDQKTATRDYARWFQSSLARDWTKPRYVKQLSSVFAGDFLIIDPSAPFDPTLPPELKASAPQTTSTATRLERTTASVPAETLKAIQESFPLPPLRYRMPFEEIIEHYTKAEKLCAAATIAHPNAPDLWIVHNRRIIAQLGLWRLTTQQSHYRKAVAVAQTALASKLPTNADLIPRYCLTKEAFREPAADHAKIIADFLDSQGGEKASGPALAAAALLAIDVGHRGLHEKYRALILKDHLNNPLMWAFNSFLLDRFQRYQLFRVPFVAGWSFGRRQKYFLSLGKPEEVSRPFEATLETLDGKPFPLPQKVAGKWTAIFFTGETIGEKAPRTAGTVKALKKLFSTRPFDDVQIIVAVTSEDTLNYFKENPLDCETLIVPGGISNPLIQQLGIISEDEAANVLILKPNGETAIVGSPFTTRQSGGHKLTRNIIQWHDEQNVIAAIKRNNLEEAQRIAFALCPPEDPSTVDPKKRRPNKPPFSIILIRSRARVYLAMGDLNAALKDIEEAHKLQTAVDGSMSMRTERLDNTEELRDLIRQKIEDKKK